MNPPVAARPAAIVLVPAAFCAAGVCGLLFAPVLLLLHPPAASNVAASANVSALLVMRFLLICRKNSVSKRNGPARVAGPSVCKGQVRIDATIAVTNMVAGST